MACDNCGRENGFWCPVCQPPKGIDTRDIHARAPIDRIKALEAEIASLRAENARLTSELDAANARIAKVREVAQANTYLVSSGIQDMLNGKEVERGD